MGARRGGERQHQGGGTCYRRQHGGTAVLGAYYDDSCERMARESNAEANSCLVVVPQQGSGRQ